MAFDKDVFEQEDFTAPELEALGERVKKIYEEAPAYELKVMARLISTLRKKMTPP